MTTANADFRATRARCKEIGGARQLEQAWFRARTDMRSFSRVLASLAITIGCSVAWLPFTVHASVSDYRILKERAERGDATAQADVAEASYEGNGVPQDYSEALRWYRKAAEQGNAKGENGMGRMYDHGQGSTQDYSEAVRWYRKAADQSYARAQYNLGYMYWNGRGVPQNRREAVKWFRKAADQGDQYALRALSRPASMFTKVILLGQVLGGMWLVYFVLFPSQTTSRRPDKFRNRAIIAFGILLMFDAAFLWYGYAHYLIRSPGYGASAFTSLRWFLNLVLVLLLIYLIGSRKKSGAGHEAN